MAYCTQLPCVHAPNSKAKPLKAVPNSSYNRLHVLKGQKGHIETPETTVCGMPKSALRNNSEMFTSRKNRLEEDAVKETACKSCQAWVKNGGPFYYLSD